VKEDSTPIRCLACLGTGNGQTVMTGKGTYIEPCPSCKGAGRLIMLVCPECHALSDKAHLHLLADCSCRF
jgi:DnaJ-class molecular chaperone